MSVYCSPRFLRLSLHVPRIPHLVPLSPDLCPLPPVIVIDGAAAVEYIAMHENASSLLIASPGRP